jgi:hypothetical protein
MIMIRQQAISNQRYFEFVGVLFEMAQEEDVIFSLAEDGLASHTAIIDVIVAMLIESNGTSRHNPDK